MRLPRGFRRGHDDTIACPHRDLSCCPACVAAQPMLFEVYGVHYWMSEAERAEYRAMIAAHQSRA